MLVHWERGRGPTRNQPENRPGGNRPSKLAWSVPPGGEPPCGTPGPTVSRSDQTCSPQVTTELPDIEGTTHEAAARNRPDGWKAIREIRWVWPASSPIGVSLGATRWRGVQPDTAITYLSRSQREMEPSAAQEARLRAVGEKERVA